MTRPRGRHADPDATDPHGFAPVGTADASWVPEPRIPRDGARPAGAAGSRADPRTDPWADPWADDAYAVPAPQARPDDHRSDDARPDGPRSAEYWGDPDHELFTVPRPGRAPARDPYAGPWAPPAEPESPEPRRRTRDTGHDGYVAPAAAPSSRLTVAAVAVPVAIGALVAVALGVWARQHEGTGVAVNLAGFSSGAAAKAWLGSLALLLAIVQGVTGRMLASGDPFVTTVHRWSGRVAVLVTVPVAVQCLYAFGWSGATTSALLHSLLGCVFYGAFVTKMLLLRRPGIPGWVLAVCGGLLLAILAGVWLTSALWFFTGHGLSF
ncbi:DUF6529 family protein [Pseudonocardia phyllosphaerae]|uniref:DUF6529 family protein n=1 Tax=Pseudonocardia phyllosphaerae TaxID=3390502 RepID=UPI00397E34F1